MSIYDLNEEQFKAKLRERARTVIGKSIPESDLDRLLPVICAARPFAIFPDSYSGNDVAALGDLVPDAPGLLHEARQSGRYHRAAAELWSLLDDIDTLSDQISPETKGDYMQFYSSTLAIAKRRHEVFKSDGYKLTWPKAQVANQGSWSAATHFVTGERKGWSAHDVRCQEELAALFDKDMSWGQIRDEVKRLVTADKNIKRVGSTLAQDDANKIIERGLQEPTLVEALALVALFDTENAVRQALRNVPEDRRETAHGGLWETFSTEYMRQVLQRWGIDPEYKRGDAFAKSNYTFEKIPEGDPLIYEKYEDLKLGIEAAVTGVPHDSHLGFHGSLLAPIRVMFDANHAALQKPIPMLLSCPMCHARHFDEGEFATRPHHSHACQAFVEADGKRRRCGHVWRPALVPTVGVEALPGFVNDPEADGG